MLPTVCFYKEFYCGAKAAYLNMFSSKSHLKETSVIIMRVIGDLTDIVKDLDGNFGPQQESNNNFALIKEEKIDVSNFEYYERRQIESHLKATDEFFKNLDRQKLDELKSSVTKAANTPTSSSATADDNNSGNGNVEPLKDDDIMLLMANFDKLDGEKKSWLLEMLSYIEKTNPERYKELKSPF